jgi:hypothetical protein
MNEGWKKSPRRPAKKYPKKHVVALRFTEPQFELLNAILDELRDETTSRAECFEQHMVAFLKYQLAKRWRRDAAFIEEWAASIGESGEREDDEKS